MFLNVVLDLLLFLNIAEGLAEIRSLLSIVSKFKKEEVYNLLVMPLPHSTFYWLSSLMHQAYVNMPQWTSHAQYLDLFMKPRLQGGIWIKGGISIKTVHFCPQHSPNRIDCIYLKDYAGKRLVWMSRAKSLIEVRLPPKHAWMENYFQLLKVLPINFLRVH